MAVRLGDIARGSRGAGLAAAWRRGGRLVSRGVGPLVMVVALSLVTSVLTSQVGGAPTAAASSSATPVLGSVEPRIAVVGDTVRLHGTDLPSGAEIAVGGVAAVVVGSGDQFVDFEVPGSASSGRVTLTTPEGTAMPGPDLYVVPGGRAPSEVGVAERVDLNSGVTVDLPDPDKIGLVLVDVPASAPLSVSIPTSTFGSCGFALETLDQAGQRIQLAACANGGTLLDMGPAGAGGTEIGRAHV